MGLHKHTLCVSITCQYCGDYMSSHNKKGFTQFIKHCVLKGCDADFTIAESISVELVE